MSMTAFDLEQDILRCWNVVDDIREILDDLESGQIEPPAAITALRAYQKVYERRFEKCFQRFEAFNREAWELRNQAQDLDSRKNPTANKGKMAKSKQQKEVDH